MTEIEDFIKKNFSPVEDKPGFVWLNKRNFQIISIEILAKSLEDARARGDIPIIIDISDKEKETK